MTKVATVNLPVGGFSDRYTVSVPSECGSLTIMAVSADAGDLDISTIIDPTGQAMVSYEQSSDPIGPNWAQGPGQSVVTFTLPHSLDYPFRSGDWSFDIRHYASADQAARLVDIYTAVKDAPAATLDINLFLVALPDYTGPDDTTVTGLVSAFRNSLGHAGLTAGEVNLVPLTGADAEALTIIDPYTDSNGNGQADDMDRLFALSADVGNQYVNLFLVQGFTEPGILGIAGGIPGPQLIQGTAHSGVVVSSFGGLSSLADHLALQADTMAHELGHYLGLFHTTERSGRLFDPISDTPECSASIYDTNGDGVVSSTECKEADGPNLMFWAAASYPQETISTAQRYVLSVTPTTR